MKDKLRSSQSSKNSQVMERSKYQSPKKSRDPQLNSQFHNFGSNDDLQYKLERIFEQAGNRQQRYINLIKEQEEKLKIQSQKYLQSLKEIKGQFLQFMNKHNTKESHAWKVAQSEGLTFRKQKSGTNRSKSKQFNLKNIQQLAKNEGKQFGELQCRIICYYFMPLASDYVRYKIPQNLIIRAGSFHPNSYISKDIRIIKQQDESDNLNSLLGKIPFQIATIEDESIAFQFKIPCNLDAINYYKHRQIQIQLINTQGMFIFAYAKLNLGPILFFEDQPSEWQIKPITFYSTLSGQKVGEMSIKFGNKVSFVSKNEHYKIQSTDPINMDKLKPMINYEDQQSRMVQRISKFKNNTNSLLLGIGSSKRQAKAEEIFENQNEKIILMHRKKKELESIMEYKQSHKSQFMDKLFNEAIDRYYLNECEIGCPKYLAFQFLSKDKNHKKLFVKAQIQLKIQQKADASSIVQYIQLSVLSPQQINMLIRQQIIDIDKAKVDYQFEEQDQTLWAASGMTHTLFLKILCQPLKSSLYKKQHLNRHYDAKLILYDEYDQQVESFTSKIKIKQPALQSKIYVHGYQHSESQLEIPFGDDQKKIKKNIITNFPNLQYKWNSTMGRLNIRIPHQILGNKNYYLIVNDSLNLYQINSFELCTSAYSRLSDDIILNIGEVKKLELQFSIDEKAKTQKLPQVESRPANKGKKGLTQVRVGFYSSKPEHCIVSCESQAEIVCQLNKIYTVDAKIQSFQTQINPQKILIHALDLDSQTILKQWLIEIKKQQQVKYKQTFRISCERGKTMKYKLDFMNESDKQRTYRFYSSNLSILTLPQSVISLISNQKITLQLEFLIREIISDEDLLEPIKVIFTATDGTNFTNYLFELNVRLR